MEFAVGASVEAVDQPGIWAKAKVISASENSVVVTFPPWRSEWDREISDLSEIRKETIEETLIPHHLAQKKVRSYSMLILSFFISFSFLLLISCLRKLLFAIRTRTSRNCSMGTLFT